MVDDNHQLGLAVAHPKGCGMTKRILQKFTIEEISFVDKPAQEHARALIMKRDTSEDTEMDLSNVDTQALAYMTCELLAKELRKKDPSLTPEQAFAKVYTDPANIEIRKAERGGAMRNLAKALPPVARTEPVVTFGNEVDTGLAALQKLAAEFRRDNPFLTPEQAFARVYQDPANRALASSERAASRERLYSGGVRTMA
jgi:hypothetical protein